MYVLCWVWRQLLPRNCPEATLKLTGSCLPRLPLHHAMYCDLMWGLLCEAIGGQGSEAVWLGDHAVSGLYHCRTPLVKTFTCCCYRSMHVASTLVGHHGYGRGVF